MKSISAQASSYVKTGAVRSKRSVVEQGVFRSMTTTNIIVGAVRELYRRFDAELYAFALFGSWAIYIWIKLG